MTVPRTLPLLKGLGARELAAVDRAAETKLVANGRELFREGDPADAMYVMLDGHADVLRRDARGVEYLIGTIAPGELIGEMAAVERKPRSATIRATEECKLLVLPASLVRSEPRLLGNVARAMSERIRAHGDQSLEHAQQRAAISELLVKTLVLLCGYAVLVSALPWVRATWPGTSTTYLSLPVIGLFGLSSFRFLRGTGWPLSRFGLGFRNLLGSVFEAALFTPLFAVVLVGVKWIMVHAIPAWRGMATIEHTDVAVRLADPQIRTLLIVYGASALVQELIVRCALQASLEDFLIGRGRVTTAIFVSALMFSVNHLHMSFLFAALAFLPGIFWGILFHRQRHILGVTLSHFAIGAFVFFVLGVRLQ
ncbi:MAG: cyclic nucleotide-binding domain-containing protein [Polyangiales bacterium]